MWNIGHETDQSFEIFHIHEVYCPIHINTLHYNHFQLNKDIFVYKD